MRFILLSSAVTATLFATLLSAAAENRFNNKYCVRIHGNPGALRCALRDVGCMPGSSECR
jgi:hypothetical protein